MQNSQSDLDAYYTAVGRSATEWNSLHDLLCNLLRNIVEPLPHALPDKSPVIAMWNSLHSDRSQRNLLKAAAKASLENDQNLPKAWVDIDWLIKSIEPIAVSRNTIIHAPVGLVAHVTVGEPEKSEVVLQGIDFVNKHARHLNKNQGLMHLLDITTKTTLKLSWFAAGVSNAISSFRANQLHAQIERSTWPDRPKLPNRGMR